MAQHIHCTVDNCHYWDSGNICLAKEILVTIDQTASNLPERVDATNMMEVSAEIGSTYADNCMTTCCKTFFNKNKGGDGTVQKITRAEYDKTKQMKV